MNRILLVFLLACSLLACGPKPRPIVSIPPTESQRDALSQQYSVYKKLAPLSWDISSTCDALLFVTLSHVGRGEEAVGLEQAESAPGEWNRLPYDQISACSSTISRDMLMGLITYSWTFKKLKWAQDLKKYALANNFVMGSETKSGETRTLMSPTMMALLALVIWDLGGEDDLLWIHIPPVYNTDPGFVSHLSMLDMLLRKEITGALPSAAVAALPVIAAHMQNNPLFHHLVGNNEQAADLVLRTWPRDRLPTSADWTEEWRLQRSDGDTGFDPGPDGKTHSGGDFLFIVSKILKDL